jgi:hypothetical protein
LRAIGDSTAPAEGSVEGGVVGASEQQWELFDTAQRNEARWPGCVMVCRPPLP